MLSWGDSLIKSFVFLVPASRSLSFFHFVHEYQEKTLRRGGENVKTPVELALCRPEKLQKLSQFFAINYLTEKTITIQFFEENRQTINYWDN
jgi:hypothetical protein